MSGDRRRQHLKLRREGVGDLQELADLVEQLLGPALEPLETLEALDSLEPVDDPDKVVFGSREGRCDYRGAPGEGTGVASGAGVGADARFRLAARSLVRTSS